MSDEGFAPPAFRAADALAGLKRSLRELQLVEREGRFELRGLAVAELRVEGEVIVARCVKRPKTHSPDWTTRNLKNSADVRKFVDELKRQMAGWNDRDD